MPSDNSGMIVLVTGATRGVGVAIVEQLTNTLQPPYTILIGHRNSEDGRRVADQFAGTTPLLLDVSSDQCINAAVRQVQGAYGRLDVLINNAGAVLPAKEDDLSDLRQSFHTTLDINVASVAVVTKSFLPLLRASTRRAKVIQISSGRASLTRNELGQVPPSRELAYTVSKAALNMLTLDMARGPENENIEFQMANPGHCRTSLNGFRGQRDPLEGAQVVVELVKAEPRETGHWETVGADKNPVKIPW